MTNPVEETIATFSDRLRNPLAAISAQVEMLLEGDHGALNSEQSEALSLVQRHSTRLLCLIEEAERSIATAATARDALTPTRQ